MKCLCNKLCQSGRGDWLTLARSAATSMSSGLLLIIVGGTQLIYILGIFLMVLAIIFAISMVEIPWLSEQLRDFSKIMSINFLWISIISVMRNWTRISSDVNSLTTKPNMPNWLGYIFSTKSPYWLLWGVLIFGLLMTFFMGKDLIHDIKEQRDEKGKRGQMIRIVAGLCCRME